MKITTHNNLVKIAADWKDWAVPVGSGLLAYLAGRGLGLGQFGSIALGAAGATGGHFARKNWNKWFPGKPAATPLKPTAATGKPNPAMVRTLARNDAELRLFDPAGTAMADLERQAYAERYREAKQQLLNQGGNQTAKDPNIKIKNDKGQVIETIPSHGNTSASANAGKVSGPAEPITYRGYRTLNTPEDLAAIDELEQAKRVAQQATDTYNMAHAGEDSPVEYPAKDYEHPAFNPNDPFNRQIERMKRFNAALKATRSLDTQFNKPARAASMPDPVYAAAEQALKMLAQRGGATEVFTEYGPKDPITRRILESNNAALFNRVIRNNPELLRNKYIRSLHRDKFVAPRYRTPTAYADYLKSIGIELPSR